jgi:hypothetical protein
MTDHVERLWLGYPGRLIRDRKGKAAERPRSGPVPSQAPAGKSARPPTTRMWAALALAVSVALSPACFVSAPRTDDREPIELHPTGDFKHPTAGFLMPESSGPFRRAAVTQYDDVGRDVSAGYNAGFEGGESLPIAATLYVYPAGENADLDTRFESLLRTIGQEHGGARPQFRKNILLSERRIVARYAAFGYEEPWGGLPETIPLHSYVVLYRWKTWWVKWRVTTPAPVDSKRMKAIVELTESLLPPADEPRPKPLGGAGDDLMKGEPEPAASTILAHPGRPGTPPRSLAWSGRRSPRPSVSIRWGKAEHPGREDEWQYSLRHCRSSSGGR